MVSHVYTYTLLPGKRDARTTVFGSSLTCYEIGAATLEDFPFGMCEQGRYAAAPEPLVMATRCIKGIYKGFEMLGCSVSEGGRC